MFGRHISWLICSFLAVYSASVHSHSDSNKERTSTESVAEVERTGAEELGALLDAGAGATVTLVAGDTRLVVHRAVVEARCPVLAATLRHYAVEMSGSQLRVPGVEGPVLRHLVAYLYTLRPPQLPHLAPQLMAAAERFGLPALRADCERQVAAQLSVETAAAVAVLAVEHSFDNLRDAAVEFISDHLIEVLASKGWGDAVVNQPKEVVQVSQLLTARQAETTAAATTQPSTQPHSVSSGSQQTARPAAPAGTPTTEGAAASHQPSDSAEEKDRWLIEAAEEGDVQELHSLLEEGADVGRRDKSGNTALHWAALRGHTAAAERLLEAGARVNATDRYGSTPLHAAAWSGHAPMVRLLVAATAGINARDEEGRTPLLQAVLRGHAEAAAALLQAGADRGAADLKGNTPRDVAEQSGNRQLVAALG